MEPEGEFPVFSLGHSEVSTSHTIKEEEYQFPPEGFPYTGSIPISVYQDLPPNYMTLAQFVSGTPSASLLYHNHVWAFGTMPTIGPFIRNSTPQQTVTSIVTSVPLQPTITNPLVSSVQVTPLVQPTVLSPTSISPSVPPVSAQVVPSSRKENLNVSMVAVTTNMSSSHAHMVGVNRPSSGAIQNPTSPVGSSNVQYQ